MPNATPEPSHAQRVTLELERARAAHPRAAALLERFLRLEAREKVGAIFWMRLLLEPRQPAGPRDAVRMRAAEFRAALAFEEIRRKWPRACDVFSDLLELRESDPVEADALPHLGRLFTTFCDEVQAAQRRTIDRN